MIPKSKCVVAFPFLLYFSSFIPHSFHLPSSRYSSPNSSSCPYYLSPSLIQTAQLKPLRGFDRLTTAGFSEEEIANVRAQFHSSRGLGSDAAEDSDGDGAIQRDEDDSESIRCFWLEGV